MQFIVNLTSFGKRLDNTAPHAIQSLLDQIEKPDRILLWLSEGTKVPISLTELEKEGLEIRFCSDFKSYNKLVPALLEYPKDVLITADDDVYYPINWFEKTKISYGNNPNHIHVNRAHEITLENEVELQPYRNWRFCVTDFNDERCIFPTGVGGILYPPNSLHPEAINSSMFLSLAPKGDDIWFWAMARLQGTKYTMVKNGLNDLNNIDPSDKGMYIENIYYRGNDHQLLKVLGQYPQLIQYLDRIIK